jgi:hypothetical protein
LAINTALAIGAAPRSIQRFVIAGDQKTVGVIGAHGSGDRNGETSLPLRHLSRGQAATPVPHSAHVQIETRQVLAQIDHDGP